MPNCQLQMPKTAFIESAISSLNFQLLLRWYHFVKSLIVDIVLAVALMSYRKLLQLVCCGRLDYLKKPLWLTIISNKVNTTGFLMMKKRTCVSTDSWLLVISWVFFCTLNCPMLFIWNFMKCLSLFHNLRNVTPPSSVHFVSFMLTVVPSHYNRLLVQTYCFTLLAVEEHLPNSRSVLCGRGSLNLHWQTNRYWYM